MNPIYIGERNGALLLDCIKYCSQNKDCDAISYSYVDPTQNEMSTIGLCQLIKNNAPGNEGPLPATGYGCTVNFTRENESNNNCVNIMGNKSSVSIDLGSGQPAPLRERVETKYLGAECRKQIVDSELDPTKDQDVLQAMGSWCQQNKDIDVCKDFCRNDNYSNFCDIKAPIWPFIFIGLCFVIIFIIVLVVIRTNKSRVRTVLISVSAIVAAGLLGYGLYQLIEFNSNKGYSGSKKDYTRSKWSWTSSGCKINVIETCSWTNPTSCGGNGYWGPSTGKCPSWCKNINTCMYSLCQAIPSKNIQKNTIIVGLTVTSGGGQIFQCGNVIYAEIGNDPLDSKINTSSTMCGFDQGRMYMCNYDTKQVIYPGDNYALQSMTCIYMDCSMVGIEFIFTDIYTLSNPPKSYKFPPTATTSGCAPQVISGQSVKCATTNPNVRWYIQNWSLDVTAAYCDDSDDHCGCDFFGLNRFHTVDFVGITTS